MYLCPKKTLRILLFISMNEIRNILPLLRKCDSLRDMPVKTKGTRPNTGSQTPLPSSKIPCGLHKSLNQQKKKIFGK